MQTPAVLDFGCGTGSTTPFLLQLPGAAHVVGMDVSSGLLEVARDAQGSDRIEFVPHQGISRLDHSTSRTATGCSTTSQSRSAATR